jgi:uncharacterized protein (TIGR02594 family)
MNQNLIDTIHGEIGVIEFEGPAYNNQEILKYFQEIGHKWVKTDETAWCSAFANWAAKICGLEYSGALDARSWLGVGIPVVDPEMGDVCIFWRESIESWKGHVAFYIGEDARNFWVLGGNQSNQVCIRRYPKYRLLEIRRLREINV